MEKQTYRDDDEGLMRLYEKISDENQFTKEKHQEHMIWYLNQRK